MTEHRRSAIGVSDRRSFGDESYDGVWIAQVDYLYGNLYGVQEYGIDTVEIRPQCSGHKHGEGESSAYEQEGVQDIECAFAREPRDAFSAAGLLVAQTTSPLVGASLLPPWWDW